MRSRFLPRAGALAGTVAVALGLAACGGGSASHAAAAAAPATPSATASATTPSSSSTATTPTGKPNIVFVLTDDLSEDLVRYMPQVQALQSEGEDYENYFVTDSLCCPSRSSIFTGDYPHDTGVFTNSGSDGGIGAFYAHDDEKSAFNVHLQAAGYRTAMMGKYLNGYMTKRSPVAKTYVPPGWNTWDVAGNGYPEFDYDLNQDGTLHHYGHAPSDYLVDVMADKGADFVRSSAQAHKPFFLELATFAPHAPYTPAPRYAHAFPGLKAPRPASYDTLPRHAPAWLAGRPRLTPRQEKKIDRAYRKRVQAIQAVDDLITKLETTLKATHELQNTYIVFSSDNGYHMGEYRLMPGKQTAFDTDIHVPLTIVGPHVPHGVESRAMVQNTDLAPTFEALAGASAPCDGQSLTPTFSARTPSPSDWRDVVLVEHHGPDHDFGTDPDAQTKASADPPSYEAMRTPDFTYVEYSGGQHELYEVGRDPLELDNVYGSLSPAERTTLHGELARLESCHGHRACWAAAHVRART